MCVTACQVSIILAISISFVKKIPTPLKGLLQSSGAEDRSFLNSLSKGESFFIEPISVSYARKFVACRF